MSDNDLIRRGSAIRMVNLHVKASRHVTLADQTIEAIAALPAVAVSQPADPVTNANSRQRMTRETLAEELASRRASYCSALPGNDEEFKSFLLGFDYAAEIALRQRVTVKPLVWDTTGCADDPLLQRLWIAKDPERQASIEARRAESILAAIDVQPDPRELTVWYGKMPESNGRENWTAILRPKYAVVGVDLNGLMNGFCFARSEFPDRVRYEADLMRWIIGELAEKPRILAYDADLHSGYVPQPDPRDARIDEATAFDRADWYWRTMDPDDCGDNPAEAVNRGMVGQFCVCEVASSYEGPTRYGFIAPVLDLESDDEEFLHFASQQEAIDAASERRAALAAVKGGDA